MSDNKRSPGSTGYYMALVLCVAAIGISGYLYHRNHNQVQQTVLQEPEIPILTETEAPRLPAPTSQVPQAAIKPAAPAPRVPEPFRTAAPVEGEAVTDYSMEALSYNETTRDWRIHNGVDYAAREGTQVRAAAGGKVYTTYDDDVLGSTVVIRHDGGYTTRYSSLREDLSVRAGDRVELGQPIGYVGTTALVESVLGPHVHFSVSCRDVPMDPEDFLSLNPE